MVTRKEKKRICKTKKNHCQMVTKRKQKKKISRKNLATRKQTPYYNDEGGELKQPKTRLQTKLYEFEKQQAPECIRSVYNLLGSIHQSRTKILYLLQRINLANGKKSIEEWKDILRKGESYRKPNIDVLSSIMLDPRQTNTLINEADIALEEVNQNKEANISRSVNPRDYQTIKLDINEKILRVLNDPDYVELNNSGNFVGNREPLAYEILNALFVTPIPPEKVVESYSISPIRVIFENITARDMHKLALILNKAKGYSTNRSLGGVIKMGKYGFPLCNSSMIVILDKFNYVYDKIFTELIRFLPAYMYKKYEHMGLLVSDYPQDEENMGMDQLGESIPRSSLSPVTTDATS